MRKRLGIFLLALAPVLSAADLNTVLANMDRASADFRGMTAAVRWVQYTALVDDASVESGRLAFRREPGKDAELKIAFTEPAPKDFLVRGTKAEIYKPRIKTVEEYDFSKSKDKVEQALLSGFGVSGKFIQKNYDVKLGGDDAVDGRSAVRLELVPKDAESRRSVPKLEMWISTESWNLIQQKIYQEGGKDYRLYHYADIALNPALKSSDFKLDLPKGVHRITPQK